MATIHSLLKVEKLRLAGKPGTWASEAPMVALAGVGGSLCFNARAGGDRRGAEQRVRSRPPAQLEHRGEQGGVQVGGGWVKAKIGDLSKMETR